MSELESQDYQDETELDDYIEHEEVDEVDEAEDHDNDPSELAPDSEPEHEENPEDNEINQEKVNEVINKKHRLWKEAEEKNAELQRQLAEIQAQNHKYSAPEIPAPPDPFDDDYEVKLKQREDAIIARARYDAEQQQIDFRNQQLKQQMVAQQQQKLIDTAKSYSDRAKKYGIKPQDLQTAGNTVAQYVSPELSQLILEDERGPLITQYLGRNPLELAQIAELPPVQAALHIERNIKAKLQAGNRKTNAPRPGQKPRGSAAPKGGRGIPEGGRFY